MTKEEGVLCIISIVLFGAYWICYDFIILLVTKLYSYFKNKK